LDIHLGFGNLKTAIPNIGVLLSSSRPLEPLSE